MIRRLALSVIGKVQGVGFRPYVYRLAHELGLTGWVRNCGYKVNIEIQGNNEKIEEFKAALIERLPGSATLTHISEEFVTPLDLDLTFVILASDEGDGVDKATLTDRSVCSKCLAELFDPQNRRYHYPFISCSHCGPRNSIIKKMPYDRINTSMSDFPMCAQCEDEYVSPEFRRFHHQANSCAACGPKLEAYTSSGEKIHEIDMLQSVVNRLSNGQLVTIKGVGGFHILCDAEQESAVRQLRKMKQRPAKPFAIMCANIRSAQQWVEMSGSEEQLLLSSERPIVVLPMKVEVEKQSLQGIAPGLSSLGIILPYSPLQYMIFHQAVGRPAGNDWLNQVNPLTLAVTSANERGAPLATHLDDVLSLSQSEVSYLVNHTYKIQARNDDSVLLGRKKSAMMLRGGRGYAPIQIPLAIEGPPILALGAGLKSTISLTDGDQAFVSEYIGNLNTRVSCEVFVGLIERQSRLLNIRPEIVVHDLHPDMFSTRFARQYAEQKQIPSLGVQHHHAHIASVLAEQRIEQPVIGVALDGVGAGHHGQVWGGELLFVDGASYSRLGSLKPMPLPGGDKSASEPWRMAAGILHMLGYGDSITSRFNRKEASAVKFLLERNRNLVYTSSAGRLIEGVAALLGLVEKNNHEAQAAQWLESEAIRYGMVEPIKQGFTLKRSDALLVLDYLPLLQEMVEVRNVSYAAALFHATFAEGVAQWIDYAVQETAVESVVLAGGCFQNRLLLELLDKRLSELEINVLYSKMVPVNDSGISLGQAWVAIHKQRNL